MVSHKGTSLNVRVNGEVIDMVPDRTPEASGMSLNLFSSVPDEEN